MHRPGDGHRRHESLSAAPRHTAGRPCPRLNRCCTSPAPALAVKASDMPDQGPGGCCTTNATMLDMLLGETGRSAEQLKQDSDRMTYLHAARRPLEYADRSDL